MNTTGHLIVLEGTDGSGKATQTGLLSAALTAAGIPNRCLEFPRYDNDSSVLVRRYLSGAYGSRPEDVNAYAASVLYTVDRFASWAEDWREAYRAGMLLLADRYTTSNAVHQASKLPEEERPAFFEWLADLEYRKVGLPEPDLVLYLDMPVQLSGALVQSRAAGAETDIHEKNAEYLRQCRICGRQAAA